ncbi:ninjurin-A-like [Macrosteles quadrilineatus]|uniref:ninjurin-A-like n=1 Tax=Macrosteles quadrilineatus TaxID=74068 RepID=UPI0023E2086C|nr:ninjurin-A-like [Macrosteles quadrilineatus]
MSETMPLNLLSRDERNKNNSNKHLDAPRRNYAGAPLALVEDDALLPPERPTSGPEMDDLDPSSRPSGASEVDDLLPRRRNNKPEEFPGVDDGLIPRREGAFPVPVDPIPRREGGFPLPVDPVHIPPKGLPDVNVYQQKKTLAQGMMDLALLTANANQLRYVLDAGPVHAYYYVSLTFIAVSILLQVSVGILLLWNSRFNINKEHHIIRANRINNFTLIGIFLITILNVFIAAFGLPDRALRLAPFAPQIASQDVEIFNGTSSTESN